MNLQLTISNLKLFLVVFLVASCFGVAGVGQNQGDDSPPVGQKEEVVDSGESKKSSGEEKKESNDVENDTSEDAENNNGQISDEKSRENGGKSSPSKQGGETPEAPFGADKGEGEDGVAKDQFEFSPWRYFGSMLLLLGVIVAGAYGLRKLRTRVLGAGTQSDISICNRVYLDQKSFIALIRVKDEELLIGGSSGSSPRLLRRYEEDAIENEPNAEGTDTNSESSEEGAESFRSRMENVMSQKESSS